MTRVWGKTSYDPPAGEAGVRVTSNDRLKIRKGTITNIQNTVNRTQIKNFRIWILLCYLCFICNLDTVIWYL
jgi:hypothetical protein